jgi:hypothetical protein
MNCPQCGAEVVAEALFCHKCGYKIAGQDSQAYPVPMESNNKEIDKEIGPAEKFQAATAQLDTTAQQERDLWQGGFSPKAMIGAWCLSAFISIVLLIIGILWIPLSYWLYLSIAIIAPWIYNLVILAYRRLSVHYLLTNQRFIHECGVVRRVINRIEVLDMDDISFEQGIVERFLGVGSIRIMSSDRSNPDLTMYGIENVREVSGLFDDTRRAERRRRGLHIENI